MTRAKVPFRHGAASVSQHLFLSVGWIWGESGVPGLANIGNNGFGGVDLCVSPQTSFTVKCITASGRAAVTRGGGGER